jgi:hypothetical protein
VEDVNLVLFGFVLMLTLFYGLLAFGIIEAARYGGWPLLGLFPGLFLLLIDYMNKMEWNPIFNNPNFITDSGVIGTVVGKMEHLHGGRVRLQVVLKKRYIPEQSVERLTGFKGLMAHLSGNVLFTVIDSANRFVDIPSEDCEAREGCVKYMGSLCGKELKSVDALLEWRLQEAENMISRQSTVLERMKALAISMAREHNMDMREVQQEVAIINRELFEARGGVQNDEFARGGGQNRY